MWGFGTNYVNRYVITGVNIETHIYFCRWVLYIDVVNSWIKRKDFKICHPVVGLLIIMRYLVTLKKIIQASKIWRYTSPSKKSIKSRFLRKKNILLLFFSRKNGRENYRDDVMLSYLYRNLLLTSWHNRVAVHQQISQSVIISLVLS